MTTTTWLEMRDPAEFGPSPPGAGVAIRLQSPPDPELNRRLYIDVGSDFQWVDRLGWGDSEWREYAHQPNLETWVMWAADTPAGYFELLRHQSHLRAGPHPHAPALRRSPSHSPRAEDDGSVQIAYFGLAPAFVGRGLGGALLTAAVERAWALGATRVWLHTSSKDHPHALTNYKARGFRVYRAESA